MLRRVQMTKKVFAITFAQPDKWTTGSVLQIGIAEEKVEEVKQYAKSIGYEENPRGALEFEANDEQYEEALNRDYKALFKENKKVNS